MRVRFYHFANKVLQIYDAQITRKELIFELIINMLYGFFANLMIPFIALKNDLGTLIAFTGYYYFLTYILNRAKYESKFARYVMLPIPCIIGAFLSYKVGYMLVNFFS